MKPFIDENGAFNYTSFVSNGITWNLVGTSTQVNHKNPLLCIDTFKSKKGTYIDKKREDTLKGYNDGKIVPVPSSEIKASVDNGKTKRRAV